MKTWYGRFTAASSHLFEAFTSSIEQDQALARFDVRVSQSHAKALLSAGLLTPPECRQLIDALAAIDSELEAGSLAWRDELEDVHTHVESWLRERVGELANKLHAGRSRNDQVATDLRLFTKESTQSVLNEILDLQEAFLELADRHRGDIMPGYTHLQQAQPVLVAFPLLAYVAMLARDWERMSDALRRCDRSPLGSGAFAGSTLPLDRDLLAREVGLGAPIENAMDAVGDRDFIVEFVSNAALCMTHLSRMAEDMIIWSSVELGFVKLPDEFASGSSMMPQKKNPDVPELIRGKTALVIGDATAILTLIKGIPSSYDRDLQEDKTPLFHASATLHGSLRVLAGMVPRLQFDTDRTAGAVSSFAAATDLAEFLVGQGVPFRDAHAAVGAAVARCLDEGRELTAVTIQELSLPEGSIEALPDLSARAAVGRKVTSGSTGTHAIEAQLSHFHQLIQERRSTVKAS